jgi:transcriptional regulator with XRE-family HTH domain
VRTHSQQGAYYVDVNKLLDTCKDVCKATTEVELASRIGVSKQALSGYRHGTRSPDPVVCATIAGLTGIPLARVLGIVGEARAISREEKAVWRKLALSACAALCAVGIGYNPTVARAETGASTPGMYIM